MLGPMPSDAAHSRALFSYQNLVLYASAILSVSIENPHGSTYARQTIASPIHQYLKAVSTADKYFRIKLYLLIRCNSRFNLYPVFQSLYLAPVPLVPSDDCSSCPQNWGCKDVGDSICDIEPARSFPVWDHTPIPSPS